MQGSGIQLQGQASIKSRSRTRIYMPIGLEGAACCANEKAAATAMQKIQPVVARYGEFEVEIIA